MDYAALKAELQDAAYSGKTDAECAALLNARDRDGPVPAKDVRRLMHLRGKMAGILASTSPAALAFRDALDAFNDFDLSVSAYANAIGAQLDAVITAGLMDSDDKAAILGIAANRRTRSEVLGFGFVSEGDVKEARK